MLIAKFPTRGVATQQANEEQTVGYLLTEGSMADGPSPTVRRRQLGMELRRLREAASKSQEDAGEWIDVPGSSISKIETGKQRIRSGDLRSLLQLYGVGSPDAEFLEQLRREADQRGWWADYGKTVPDWFRSYLGMESAAAEAWTYEAEFVPGLLQIPEYVAAVTAAMNPDSTCEQIRSIAEVRATRQKRLTTGGEALTLRAVINEGALRRQVGGPDVMRAQAQRIAELAELPNVTVQVLPFTVGAHPGMLSAFTMLRFPEEPMNTVYVELDSAALYLETPAEIERYANTFERLSDLALDRDGTVDLLAQIGR